MNILPAQEFELLGGRLFIAPMRTKDVVSVEGSVRGGPHRYAHTNEMLPGIAAELLDAGTPTKKKAVMREALAARGISLSFSSRGDRTHFSGHSFPEDLPFLLSTIAECLGLAMFPESEVKAARARELGSLREAKSDTSIQASVALSRLLYDPAHLNYDETIETLEKQLQRVNRKELLGFRKLLGTQGLILAITGDVTEIEARSAAEKAFRKLGRGVEALPQKKRNTKIPQLSEKKIPIADKANIDVLLGAALPLVRHDPLYRPLAVLTEMLGGGFASHLMQTVRERDGLTYRTYATLAGFSDGLDGYFEVYASFNPGRYTESVEKLRAEVREFFAAGITEEALARKKEEIAGSYLVGLSTTRGLARTLHALAADGRDLSYLREYPALIQAVSLKEVHAAADCIPLERLSLAAAGTFPKK